VPNARRPLSEGLVVQASVVARLFRVHLLAIDASVVISPAHVHGRAAAARPNTQRRAIGAGLVAAERLIDEGASSLASSRATGTTTSAR